MPKPEAPREIYHSPANDFVADFVGTVNRLRGTVGKGGVDLGGRAIKADTGSAAQGTPIDILFRPEDADIVSVEEADFSGKVQTSFFLGSRTRLVLTSEDGQPVIIDSSGRDSYAIGQEIGVRVRPEGVRTGEATR